MEIYDRERSASYGGYRTDADLGTEDIRNRVHQGGYAFRFGDQIFVAPCANIWGKPDDLFGAAMDFCMEKTETEEAAISNEEYLDYRISMLPEPCPLARECAYFDETNKECGQGHGSCYFFHDQKQAEKPSCPLEDFCNECFMEGLACCEDYRECITYRKLDDQAYEAIMIKRYGFDLNTTPDAADMIADRQIEIGQKAKILARQKVEARLEVSHSPKPPRLKGNNRGVRLPQVIAQMLEEENEAEDFDWLNFLDAPGLEEFLPKSNGHCRWMEKCRRADPGSLICRERHADCYMFE